MIKKTPSYRKTSCITKILPFLLYTSAYNSMIVNLLHLVRMIAWGWEEPWAYLVGEGNFITLIYCIQATMNVTSINLIPYLGCHFSKENWKMLYLFLFSHKGLKNRVTICILLMYLRSHISKGWILDERFNGGCV